MSTRDSVVDYWWSRHPSPVSGRPYVITAEHSKKHSNCCICLYDGAGSPEIVTLGTIPWSVVRLFAKRLGVDLPLVRPVPQRL